jgi:hypothetical protein
MAGVFVKPIPFVFNKGPYPVKPSKQAITLDDCTGKGKKKNILFDQAGPEGHTRLQFFGFH